jgi:dipeptidyl aminopeptidase/acylaminoacyl peptidase
MLHRLSPALFLSICAFAQTLTPEQAMKTRDLTDPRWSPDGRRVAVVVREPFTARFAQRHIWIYDAPAAEFRQWTFSTKSETSPRWSPDGKWLAFLSDREDSDQIWLMSLSGGEPVKLTSAKNSVSSFDWSPDGARIAYLARDPSTEADDKKSKEFDDARVIDEEEKRARLWTIDLSDKKPHQETKGAWAIRGFDWFPDSKRLLLEATDDLAPEKLTARIFTLTLADGSMNLVLRPRGPFGNLKVSPDGASFAYTGARLDGPSAHDLYISTVANPAPRNASLSIDRPVSRFEWMDSSEIAALIENGFHTELNVIGTKPRKLIANDSADASAFSRSKAGAIAYIAGTASTIPELWIDGKAVTHINAEFDSLHLVKPEFFRYTSFDNAPIEAALYRAPSAKTDQPAPLVVMVHGGPTAQWSNRFDALTQLLAARGYDVVQPNIRGSTGYGHKFIEANRGDWGGGDFKDVMALVDDLIKRNIADPKRLAICGWSYGGYMAEWAITQTTRFQAAISGAGLSDLAMEFGTESSSAYDEWFYGTPYENLASFQKSSPITYIKNAKTPTLILQGEADTTDPISQSQVLYRGLKRYGAPAQFVVYPREPHGLREQKHILDRYNRTIAWVEKYLPK